MYKSDIFIKNINVKNMSEYIRVIIDIENEYEKNLLDFFDLEADFLQHNIFKQNDVLRYVNQEFIKYLKSRRFNVSKRTQQWCINKISNELIIFFNK